MALSFNPKKMKAPTGIGNGQSLLEPDLTEPYNMWKASPNPDSTAGILQVLQPSIDQGLRLFTGQTAPSPNLRSRARQTVLSALKTYSPNKGTLRTHVVNAMQGMRRINRQEQTPYTVPDRAFLDRARIQHVTAELEDEFGREPSDMEIADRSGFSIKRIANVRKMVQPAIPTSRFEQMGDEESGGFSPAVVSKQTHNLLQAAVYDELDPVGQKVFEWSLGYNNHPVLQNAEIARRLGLSPSAVTQRKERIQRRMDELSRLDSRL